MTETIVRPFVSSEWKQYRDTRLNALQDSPDAFGSVFEKTSLLPDSEWMDRLTRLSPEIDLPLAALVGTEFAGMAWARFDEPEEKVANLYQMWVSPKFRGNGLGRKLLDATMEWAVSHGAKVMLLGVTYGETSARRLYGSAGFMPVGPLKTLRPGSKLKSQTMEYVFTNEHI